MNILIANWTWYPSGGDWTTIENLIKLYKINGHKVIPFSMEDPRNYNTPYNKYFVKNIDYKELNKKKTFSNGIKVLKRSIYSFESKVKLEKLLQDTNIDVASLHNLGPQITSSILPVLKKHNIPILQTLHDYGILCPAVTMVRNGQICEECKGNKFYRCTIYKCKKKSILASVIASLTAYKHNLLNVDQYIDCYICPSDFLRKKFIEYGFDRDKLINIYNPYDISCLENIKSESNPNLGDYILYVGRLEEVKGVYTLIKAFREIQDVNLVIIGNGTAEDKYKEFVLKNNLKNIFFLGKLDREEVLGYMKRSLFTVCPSEWYENLPYSVVESLLMRKPVIGSRIGGIPELVVDDYTGLTFESGNVYDLKEKISCLLKDQRRINKYGNNGRNHVSKLVDFDAHYQKMDQIFNKLKLTSTAIQNVSQ